MNQKRENPSDVTISGGSRLVIDGARNIGSIPTAGNDAANVNAVVAAISNGTTFPGLIAAQESRGNGTLILIEGHTRATAYLIANKPEPIDVIVSSSSSICNWMFC